MSYSSQILNTTVHANPTLSNGLIICQKPTKSSTPHNPPIICRPRRIWNNKSGHSILSILQINNQWVVEPCMLIILCHVSEAPWICCFHHHHLLLLLKILSLQFQVITLCSLHHTVAYLFAVKVNFAKNWSWWMEKERKQ